MSLKITRYILLLLLTGVSIPKGTCQQVTSTMPAEAATETTQKNNQTTLIWGTIGGGSVQPGIGGLLRLAYAWNKESSISLKAEGGGKLNIFGPADDVSEFSIYYGRQYLEELFLFRAAAGPAYIVRTKPELTYRRLGIGLEVEAMFKYKFFGLGFMVTYMYARDISQPGLIVGLSVGKLE